MKIISGGQTGVDRGALEAALDLGVACGGWCPAGRRAEDGPISDRFPLQETESAGYPARTERNVVESSATVLLYMTHSPGTKRTAKLCRDHRKPYLPLKLRRGGLDEPGVIEDDVAIALTVSFLQARASQLGTAPLVVNFAGNRESRAPGIQARTRRIVTAVLRQLGHGKSEAPPAAGNRLPLSGLEEDELVEVYAGMRGIHPRAAAVYLDDAPDRARLLGMADLAAAAMYLSREALVEIVLTQWRNPDGKRAYDITRAEAADYAARLVAWTPPKR